MVNSMYVFFRKVCDKICLMCRKKWFREFTGNDVSTIKILGHINIINKNIKVGKNVTFYEGVKIFGDGLVIIGDNVSIGFDTIIYSSKNGGGVTIGDNSQIAAQVYIIDMDHGTRANELIRNQENSVSPISIGNDVWISAGCKVLKGSIIEDGVIVGAQSLVKGKLEKNTICVGIPAKPIKMRV